MHCAGPSLQFCGHQGLFVLDPAVPQYITSFLGSNMQAGVATHHISHIHSFQKRGRMGEGRVPFLEACPPPCFFLMDLSRSHRKCFIVLNNELEPGTQPGRAISLDSSKFSSLCWKPDLSPSPRASQPVSSFSLCQN